MPRRNRERYTSLGRAIDEILEHKSVSQKEAGRRMVAQGLERAYGGDALNNLMRGVTTADFEIIFRFSRAVGLDHEEEEELVRIALAQERERSQGRVGDNSRRTSE